MQVLRSAEELRRSLCAERRAGREIGFVPTTGALHEGHRALLRASASECRVSVLSVFVNPLQFGPGEDLERYPRTLDADLEVARAERVGYVFVPEPAELYPPPVLTTVHVAGITEPLEGAFRPGHFDGVATVLTRLFGVVGCCRAYFGEKDFQQLLVVRQMVTELRMPVEVVGCPTVREHDGLARSSRNRRLDPAARAAAPCLYRALRAGAEAVAAGEADPGVVRERMAQVIASEPLARADYLEVVDPACLVAPERIAAPVRLLGAVHLGDVRLIDNLAAAPAS